MSRYKKASLNEVELPQIDGVTAILRPSRDEKMLLVEKFMEYATNKKANLPEIRTILTDLLYQSLFVWEENKRTDKKEAGSEDITRDDIDEFVVKNLLQVWSEVLIGLEIVDKQKAKELDERLKKEEADKIKEDHTKNPN